MNNRLDSNPSAEKSAPVCSSSAQLMEAFSKMLVNGTCVAMTMYPLDRAIHDIQVRGVHVGVISEVKKNILSFSYLKSHFNPFMISAKVYVQRNALASNRGAMAEGIDGLAVVETPFMKAGVLAASISAVNTLFTNKGSNDRVWAFQQHAHPETFMKPKIKTMTDFVKACLVGSPARFVRNTFDISGLIMSEYIKHHLSSEPEEHRLPTSIINIAAITSASVSMGLAENTVDLLSRNQAVHVNALTLKVPSLWKVARDMMKNNGSKVFLRGSLLSCAYQAIYCASFPLIEQASDKVVPSMIGLFASVKIGRVYSSSSMYECKAPGFGR